ncbi:MAG TPA: CDP-alcohol phosphatidyltransferase family protein [Thermoanaerobaculia bacterium]
MDNPQLSARRRTAPQQDTSPAMRQEEVSWDRRFWLVQAITAARVILSVALPSSAATCQPAVVLSIYVIALLTDIADGALARRWNRATRGGDWFDTCADRLLTTMSGIYGLLIGAPVLACSLIVARDLSAVSMNEIQSEAAVNARRARFLGIITVTPVRVVTAYVLIIRVLELNFTGLAPLYWTVAVISWSTFAVNAWLRRSVVGEWFREPDVDKLLR